MTPEKKHDFDQAVNALEDYERLYQFMALGSQIHTTFQMIYRTMNQDFPIPAVAWRYSPEYNIEKKLFEAEALFNVFYKMCDAAKDCPEWIRKIEVDLGKHMSFLYGLFPRPLLEKYAADIPCILKFVMNSLTNRKAKRGSTSDKAINPLTYLIIHCNTIA